MNYTVAVFYTNSTDIRRFNADTLDGMWRIVEREKLGRFVRKIEVSVLLETFTVHRT